MVVLAQIEYEITLAIVGFEATYENLFLSILRSYEIFKLAVVWTETSTTNESANVKTSKIHAANVKT